MSERKTVSKIPIYKGRGNRKRVIGYALVDDEHSYLNEIQWRLDNGYAAYARRVSGKTKITFLHNVIFNLKYGREPKRFECDHANRVPLDCRSCNLRPSNRSQQLTNRVIKRGGRHSQYRGVGKNRNGWKAEINVNGVKRYIGTYKTQDEAAFAYNAEAQIQFGEFAVLNVIPSEVTTR